MTLFMVSPRVDGHPLKFLAAPIRQVPNMMQSAAIKRMPKAPLNAGHEGLIDRALMHA